MRGSVIYIARPNSLCSNSKFSIVYNVFFAYLLMFVAERISLMIEVSYLSNTKLLGINLYKVENFSSSFPFTYFSLLLDALWLFRHPS